MTNKTRDDILDARKKDTGPERKGNAADEYRQNEEYSSYV